MSTSSANALRNSRASSGPPRRLASKSLRIHTRSARASPRDASAAFASSDPFPAAAPAPLSAPKTHRERVGRAPRDERTARCEGTYASLAGWRDTAAASAANTAVAVGSRARRVPRDGVSNRAEKRRHLRLFANDASTPTRPRANAGTRTPPPWWIPRRTPAPRTPATTHPTPRSPSARRRRRRGALREKGRTHAGSYPAAGAGPRPSSGVESDPSSAETSPRSEGGGAGTPRACGNLTAVAAHRRASGGAPPRSAAAMDPPPPPPLLGVLSERRRRSRRASNRGARSNEIRRGLAPEVAESGETTAPRGGVQRRQQRREVAIARGQRGAVRRGEEGNQSRWSARHAAGCDASVCESSSSASRESIVSANPRVTIESSRVVAATCRRHDARRSATQLEFHRRRVGARGFHRIRAIRGFADSRADAFLRAPSVIDGRFSTSASSASSRSSASPPPLPRRRRHPPPPGG